MHDLLGCDRLLTSFDFGSFETCESCLLGKMTKSSFAKSCERASELLELIHNDVCGPMSTTARGGYQYFVTFTDDLSRHGYIYLMRHKSETFEKFKEFQNEVENQLSKMTKSPFTKSCERVSELLELIHSDVCGPVSTTARGGYQYFVTFTDDLSRYGYIYLMRHKSETFEKFKEFQNEVENQLGKTIKLL